MIFNSYFQVSLFTIFWGCYTLDGSRMPTALVSRIWQLHQETSGNQPAFAIPAGPGPSKRHDHRNEFGLDQSVHLL